MVAVLTKIAVSLTRLMWGNERSVKFENAARQTAETPQKYSVSHDMRMELGNELRSIQPFPNQPLSMTKFWYNSAYSKLVWSHKGNKAATNGSGKTPDQFSNWSSTVFK